LALGFRGADLARHLIAALLVLLQARLGSTPPGVQGENRRRQRRQAAPLQTGIERRRIIANLLEIVHAAYPNPIRAAAKGPSIYGGGRGAVHGRRGRAYSAGCFETD